MMTPQDQAKEAYDPDQSYEQLKAEAAKWRARWPAHCQRCSGWGMFTHYESHGFKGGGSEQINEPCTALWPEDGDEQPYCHRCGELGLNPDTFEGPCTQCGWNYDDGAPQL